MVAGVLPLGWRALIDTTAMVPPHSLEAEESVLGAILLDPDAALIAIASGLQAEHFYRQDFGEAFRVIRALVDSGQPIDATSVVTGMQPSKRDGPPSRIFTP